MRVGVVDVAVGSLDTSLDGCRWFNRMVVQWQWVHVHVAV